MLLVYSLNHIHVIQKKKTQNTTITIKNNNKFSIHVNMKTKLGKLVGPYVMLTIETTLPNNWVSVEI